MLKRQHLCRFSENTADWDKGMPKAMAAAHVEEEAANEYHIPEIHSRALLGPEAW